MSTVSIIGAGPLGGAVAEALGRGRRVSRVILVDDAGEVAAGKALDIQQAGAVEGFAMRLRGTSDPSLVAGSAVCVIADRHGEPATEWAGEPGRGMMRRLLPYLGAAPVVFAGTEQAALLQGAGRDMGLRRERLLGSCAEAAVGAIKSLVAAEAHCSPSEVDVTVLGAPPRGLVVPWSGASIGGYALERVLTQVQLSRLEARVPALWPPGPFALGQAAAGVAEALVSASRRTFCLLAVLDGEFGVRHRVGVLPAVVAAGGLVHARMPTLSAREQVQLDNALESAVR
jgi:malate dehydrogenase